MFKSILFLLMLLFFISGYATNNKIQELDTPKIKIQKSINISFVVFELYNNTLKVES